MVNPKRILRDSNRIFLCPTLLKADSISSLELCLAGDEPMDESRNGDYGQSTELFWLAGGWIQ